MTVTVYAPGARFLSADFTSATYRALLLKSPFEPDPTTQDFVSDITANELTGVGYSRPTLGGKTETVSVPNNRVTYDCNDLSFGSIAAGETATYMVVYRFVTNDAGSNLVAAFQIDRVTNGAAVSVTVNAAGLLQFRAG